MLTASIVCPHCQKSDLAVFAELHEIGAKAEVTEDVAARLATLEKSPASTAKMHHQSLLRNREPLAYDKVPCASLLFCQRCFMPILAIFRISRIEYANHVLDLRKIGTGQGNSRLSMDDLSLFPAPQENNFHQAWPSRVQRLVPDIERALQAHLDPSIAIATCRTVIDVCMKDLGGEGRDIFSRINDLLKKGVITKPIADWAHQVRLLGADATHDAEGTEEDAKELLRFIRFFLQAAYELGAEIARGLNGGAPSLKQGLPIPVIEDQRAAPNTSSGT